MTVITGDIRERADVDRAMEGVDAVVHTAAALPLYSKRDIVTTDIHGIRNVLEASGVHEILGPGHMWRTISQGVRAAKRARKARKEAEAPANP